MENAIRVLSLFLVTLVHVTQAGTCEADPSESSYNMGWHVGGIFLIFGTSLFGTLIPILFWRHMEKRWVQIFLACAKCMAGGVLLGTAFVHMYTEAQANLTSECLSSVWHSDFESFAAVFAIAGIFLVHAIQTISSSKIKEHREAKGLTVTTPLHPEHHDHAFRETSLGTDTPPSREPSVSSVLQACESHRHSAIFLDPNIEKKITTYLLEVGVATHSVIIGLTLGVTPMDEFKTLLLAIMFHQFLEGIALSTIVKETGFISVWSVLLMIVFYTLSTPIGMAIGIGVHNTYQESAVESLLSRGILDALSAGILVYDSLVNVIIPHCNSDFFAKSSDGVKILQLFAMWTGAGVMSFIGRYA